METINSVAGGRVVKETVWVLSGAIPAVVTRNEPFTLRLEGAFIEKDGRKRRFTIEQHYDIEREQGKKSAAEVLRDA